MDNDPYDIYWANEDRKTVAAPTVERVELTPPQPASVVQPTGQIPWSTLIRCGFVITLCLIFPPLIPVWLGLKVAIWYLEMRTAQLALPIRTVEQNDKQTHKHDPTK